MEIFPLEKYKTYIWKKNDSFILLKGLKKKFIKLFEIKEGEVYVFFTHF